MILIPCTAVLLLLSLLAAGVILILCDDTTDRLPSATGNNAVDMSLPQTSQNPSTDRPTNAWNLILVNSQNPLPHNFSVELTQLRNGHAIDRRAYPDLQDMMDAARAQGLSPLICSSYRTAEKQQTLYENQIKKLMRQGYSMEKAKEEAGKWVAVPGTSEHQTGLAVDIVSTDYQILDQNQGSTAEQKWLIEHAWEYGFILRYPTGKGDITGIHYEPWHYRYVGKDAAKEIHERGICLEEYLRSA